MPRTARIDIPGLLQHVMVRGIEKRDIFLDDDDKALFLERLSKFLIATGTDCRRTLCANAPDGRGCRENARVNLMAIEGKLLSR